MQLEHLYLCFAEMILAGGDPGRFLLPDEDDAMRQAREGLIARWQAEEKSIPGGGHLITVQEAKWVNELLASHGKILGVDPGYPRENTLHLIPYTLASGGRRGYLRRYLALREFFDRMELPFPPLDPKQVEVAAEYLRS